MAYSIVQDGQASYNVASGSYPVTTPTFGANFTQGNVVLAFTASSNQNPSPGVRDSNNNVFTLIAQYDDVPGTRWYSAWGLNVPAGAGNSVNINDGGGATYTGVWACEIGGVQTLANWVNAITTGTTIALGVNATSTTQPGAQVLFCFDSQKNATASPVNTNGNLRSGHFSTYSSVSDMRITSNGTTNSTFNVGTGSGGDTYNQIAILLPEPQGVATPSYYQSNDNYF
jgi:hypothetical protein